MRRGTAGLVVVGVLFVGGCTGTPAPQETPHVEVTVRLTGPEPTWSPLPRERAAREVPLRPDGSTVVVRPSEPEGAQALLAGLLADDEGFATVRIDRDGTLVLVWHGPPPQEALASVAEAYPDVPVRVEPTDVPPGDLQEVADSLVGDDRYRGVRAAYVSDDLASIVVQVDRSVTNTLTLAERLTAEIGFPVVVEGAAPVPTG